MELQITGTNMQITAPVRVRVEEKIGKLNRFFPDIIDTKVDFSEEKTKSAQQHYLVRATVTAKKVIFHGEERGPDIFQAIDRLANILETQIERHKGKRRNKKGNQSARTEPVSPPPAEPREVVKIKRFSVKPMTSAEAIEQMEALGHDFYLYLDAPSEALKLLYRRKDGDYGLIEPEIG